jgi:hypothetical protein
MTDDMNEHARLQLAMTGVHGGLIGNHATAFAHDAANVRRDQIIDHATERERAAWMAGRDAALASVKAHSDRARSRMREAYSLETRAETVPQWSAIISHLDMEYDAIRALTPPDAAPWQPPPEADRPYEYECLGKVMGGWTGVVWFEGEWCYDQTLDPCKPTAFHPLPE